MNLAGTNARVYTPDRWVILRHPEGAHTVLGGWGGGYLHGASWRRSTAIQRATAITEELHTGKLRTGWTLDNASGSVYEVWNGGYGTTSMTAGLAAEGAEHGIAVLHKDEAIEFLESLSSQSSEIHLESEQ